MNYRLVPQFIRDVGSPGARVLHYIHRQLFDSGIPALLKAEQILYKPYNFRLERLADVLQPLAGPEEPPHEDRQQVLGYRVEVRHEPVRVLQVAALGFDH